MVCWALRNTFLHGWVKIGIEARHQVNRLNSQVVKIGKLKSIQVHIFVDDRIPPVQQPYRRIPVALKEKVDKELEKLQADDIIEAAKGHVTWVSPLVIVPKSNDSIRLCVPINLNGCNCN
jgi:hypothetical protein